MLVVSTHGAFRPTVARALSRTPFVDSTELALILGEPHATVHRTLGNLLAEGIAGRVSHGTALLPSSQRYHLTAQGIGEAAGVLGFDTPSDFVRSYPMSREWLTLLARRMDAVASVYRLAASLSPGIDGLRSRVEFHRRGRFDATITLHDGRSFGVVRQGLALRRRGPGVVRELSRLHPLREGHLSTWRVAGPEPPGSGRTRTPAGSTYTKMRSTRSRWRSGSGGRPPFPAGLGSSYPAELPVVVAPDAGCEDAPGPASPNYS